MFEEKLEEKITTIDEKRGLSIVVEQHTLMSDFLEREVTIDFYLPPGITSLEDVSLLLINDGQDLPKMPFDEILEELTSANAIEPLLCVGIHCGPYRDQEYGTECRADYKGRGARAGLYKKFVFDELMPFIRSTYIPYFKEKCFAGFSLGGLTALDIVWNHPAEFTKTGVFSGSLWWRRKSIEDGYDEEKDRIMHLQVEKGRYYPWLKFFIETGCLDETADRNNNGIIDSVDDALGLIAALKEKGYSDDQIRYVELDDGRHDVETWGRIFPDFLRWGWGK